MNLAALLTACRKALLGHTDWAEKIDVSKSGFWQSYIALILSLPAYYICALAIAQKRAQTANTEPTLISAFHFSMVAIIYLLSFSGSLFIICSAFNKQDCYHPWAILRHWSVFFITLLAATLYGLSLLGILPFVIASFSALALYLAILAIDIRLAQRIGKFELTAAIFTACIIFAMGLSVLLMGVVQLGGAI